MSNTNTRIAQIVSFLVMNFTFFLAMSAPASAQAVGGDFCSGDTIGGMFCAFQDSSLKPVAFLILGICFIGGVFLTYKGIVELMKTSDSQSQAGISSGLLQLAAGAFLVALPATISVGLATFGASGGIWEINTEQTSPGEGSLDGTDFLTIIGNFAINAAGPLATLVMGMAVVIGIALVASSVFSLAKISSPQSRQESIGSIGTKFFIGILLVNIFWVIEAISTSFGISIDSEMTNFSGMSQKASEFASEATGSGEDMEARFQLMMKLAFLALVPFGLIAFVRGLLIVKDSVEGTRQASMGSGFTHLVGGVALVNAESVSCAVMNTLIGGASFCP